MLTVKKNKIVASNCVAEERHIFIEGNKTELNSVKKAIKLIKQLERIAKIDRNMADATTVSFSCGKKQIKVVVKQGMIG